MKKAMFIILAFATVVLASCSKSSDPTPVKPTAKDSVFIVSSFEIPAQGVFTVSRNADRSITSITSEGGVSYGFNWSSNHTQLTITVTNGFNLEGGSSIVAKFNADSTIASYGSRTFNYAVSKEVQLSTSSSASFQGGQYHYSKHSDILALDSIVYDNYDVLRITSIPSANPFAKGFEPEIMAVLLDHQIDINFMFDAARITSLNYRQWDGTGYTTIAPTTFDYTFNNKNLLTKLVTGPTNWQYTFTWMELKK